VNMYILENDPKEHFSQGVMKFMESSTRNDLKEVFVFLKGQRYYLQNGLMFITT